MQNCPDIRLAALIGEDVSRVGNTYRSVGQSGCFDLDRSGQDLRDREQQEQGGAPELHELMLAESVQREQIT